MVETQGELIQSLKACLQDAVDAWREELPSRRAIKDTLLQPQLHQMAACAVSGLRFEVSGMDMVHEYALLHDKILDWHRLNSELRVYRDIGIL